MGVAWAVVARLRYPAAAPNPLVQLIVAGTAGLLVYVPAAIRFTGWGDWFLAIRRKEADVVAD